MVRYAKAPAQPFSPEEPIIIDNKPFFTARQLGRMLGYKNMHRESALRLYHRNKKLILKSDTFLVRRARARKSERVFAVAACITLAKIAKTKYKQETIDYLKRLDICETVAIM